MVATRLSLAKILLGLQVLGAIVVGEVPPASLVILGAATHCLGSCVLGKKVCFAATL